MTALQLAAQLINLVRENGGEDLAVFVLWENYKDTNEIIDAHMQRPIERPATDEYDNPLATKFIVIQPDI